MRKHPHNSVNTRNSRPKAVKENKNSMSGLLRRIDANFLTSWFSFDMRRTNSKRFYTNYINRKIA